jgi:hypothetical protein
MAMLKVYEHNRFPIKSTTCEISKKCQCFTSNIRKMKTSKLRLKFLFAFFPSTHFFWYCSPSQFSLPLLSWAAPTKRNSFVVMKKKFNFLIYIGDSFAHPLTKIIKLFYLDGRSHATCSHF